jgi:hypothetical protein
MGAPFGGSFFSGAVVPYPTISYPVVVPGFVSTNTVSPAVATLASARPALPQAQQVAATIRDLRARRDAAVVASATRGSNPASRLRAARQVAIGDRYLRTANGEPAALRRAVDAYRRAAAISGDQPDTFVRQAIALVALGDRGQAILRQIAEQAEPGTAAEGKPVLAGVTARWAARFGAGPATVAQR